MAVCSTTTAAAGKNEPRPPTWKVWVLASRPHTLTASIAPVIVGHFATVAFLEAVHPPGVTSQWLLFCMCIQLGTNLHNDYADFVRGADTQLRVGQARATQKGWLTPEQMVTGCTLLLAIALAIGLGLLQRISAWDDILLLTVLLTSIVNAVAYTGGPFPLGYIGLPDVSIAYSGLGDVFCFVYFGLVATLTVPYLHVRRHYNELSSLDVLVRIRPCLFAALPVGFLATAIIVVNNLRDRHTDVLAGKRTLAVRFGGTFCRLEYSFLVLGSYGMVIAHYLQNDQKQHWSCLLPFLSIPMVIPQLKAIWTKEGSDLNPHVGGTARLQLVFCILLSASL